MAAVQLFKISDTSRYTGDAFLIICALLLVLSGLVMMTSASVGISDSLYGDAFFLFKKQSLFLLMGLIAGFLVSRIPLKIWQNLSPALYLTGLFLLILVLIPGIGKEVNNATRWLDLGFMSFQASEPAKLFFIMTLAAVLAKYRQRVTENWKGLLVCIVAMILPLPLLLMEPDFGASVVLMLAVFGVLFLAGVKVVYFVIAAIFAAGSAGYLILGSTYRMKRIEAYMQALSDPFHEDVVFGSGYQLAQALIGFGRGEWFGVGLGNSIQKMYFLPEAQTDFVLAIIAEELGAMCVLVVLFLYLALIVRAMLIARKSEESGNLFSAYLGYGIALILFGQTVINAGVNTGLLPNKGLTLPFMSYGGASLIICLVMIGILLRIDIEHRREHGGQ